MQRLIKQHSGQTRITLPSKTILFQPQVVAGVAEERQNMKSKQTLYYIKNGGDLPPLNEGDVVRVQSLDRSRKSWQNARVHKKVWVRSY